MDYRIEDFTIDRYEEFLIEGKRRFVFAGFNDYPIGRRILLRHDLDLSVSSAHKIALVEHEHGIRATYFLLLHSPFYNLFDVRNHHFIQDICKMGHHIGLHFDSHFYNITSEEELNSKIVLEKNILSSFFNIDIRAFSFHLTNAFTMNCRNDLYGGLINAYSNTFQVEYAYCSDSYGLWRFKRLFDFVRNTQDEKLQVLTHPEWWVHEPSMPEKRIQNIIDEVTAELQKDAAKNYIYKEIQ